MSVDYMISLGHNSSVIAQSARSCVAYEEERLDGRKSSSAFPKRALEATRRFFPDEEPTAYVTHWFDQFSLHHVLKDDKYFDENALREITDVRRIVTHTPELTHHDAHAWSVIAFREFYTDVPEGAMIVVADGFGNFQEVLSIYEWRFGSLRLKRRVYGYENSLGLMYQFATSFVSMKPHEDEYKFLGYMNRSKNAALLQERGRALGRKIFARWGTSRVPDFDESFGSRIDLAQLSLARDFWYREIYKNVEDLDCQVSSRRADVGVLVQEALETAIMHEVGNPDHLLVAGGCFMNVRLNDRLCRAAKKSFTVMPLAGDQGAAIGMRRALTGRMMPEGDLVWGSRPALSDEDVSDLTGRGFMITSRSEFAKRVAGLLMEEDKIVNVFDTRGMEFGSRALCRTSTLALPTLDNVNLINKLNGRDTVMPMAPVMRRSMYRRLFPRSAEKIVGSEHFMIAACSARGVDAGIIQSLMPGASHPDPFKAGVLSCRPQVVDEFYDTNHLYSLLGKIDAPCLINTSLNLHGQPIVFSLEGVKQLKDKWAERTDDYRFATVVIVEDDF